MKVGGRPLVCMIYLSFARTPLTTGVGVPSTTSFIHLFNTPVGKVLDHRFFAFITAGNKSETPSPDLQLTLAKAKKERYKIQFIDKSWRHDWFTYWE